LCDNILFKENLLKKKENNNYILDKDGLFKLEIFYKIEKEFKKIIKDNYNIVAEYSEN